MPLSDVIAVRRLIYLQNIIKKHTNKILKTVYNAQKVNPCKGDLVNIVEGDTTNYDINLSDEVIANMYIN